MEDVAMEHAERIAALEVIAEHGKAKGESMDVSMEKLHDEVKGLTDTINGMREELARYRGFWGGALLVISAVGTFLTFAWDWLASQVKGG